MLKAEVKAVLEYGIGQGYVHTGELSDEEVDKVLLRFHAKSSRP